MTIGIIKNKKQHAEALAQLEALMVAEPSPGSADDRTMELLGHLIDDYESKSFPSEPVTQADLLEFLMDLHDLSQADLAPLVGGKSRVSEVLKGVRPLSVRAMSLLKTAFHLEWETIMSCRASGAEEFRPYEPADMTPKGAELAEFVVKSMAKKRPSKKSKPARRRSKAKGGSARVARKSTK